MTMRDNWRPSWRWVKNGTKLRATEKPGSQWWKSGVHLVPHFCDGWIIPGVLDPFVCVTYFQKECRDWTKSRNGHWETIILQNPLWGWETSNWEDEKFGGEIVARRVYQLSAGPWTNCLQVHWGTSETWSFPGLSLRSRPPTTFYYKVRRGLSIGHHADIILGALLQKNQLGPM